MDGTILVGIDGSVASRAAITWAISRAGDQRTGVSLLSVVASHERLDART